MLSCLRQNKLNKKSITKQEKEIEQSQISTDRSQFIALMGAQK